MRARRHLLRWAALIVLLAGSAGLASYSFWQLERTTDRSREQVRELRRVDRARAADFAQGYSLACAESNQDRFAIQRILILMGRDQISRFEQSHRPGEILETVPGLEAFWRGLLLVVPPRNCARELARILATRGAGR